MDNGIVIALIASIPGIAAFILGIMTMRASARKDTMTFLSNENARLWVKNQELQDEIDELRDLVNVLRDQVRKLGEVPAAARPKKRDTRPLEDV